MCGQVDRKKETLFFPPPFSLEEAEMEDGSFD